MTGVGLLAAAIVLPLMAQTWSFGSTLVLCVLQAMMFAMATTPSLTFMADATTEAGLGSFGTAYGFYNAVWAVGVLVGPALGGYLYERFGYAPLSYGWAAVMAAITLALPIFRSAPTAHPSPASPTDARS
jgi:MFS family permease